MKFTYYRNLNKNERYVTNKKQVKSNLPNDENITVVMGLSRVFELDSRCSAGLKIKGTVVASISCQRDKTIGVSFFPISRNLCNEKAYEEFNAIVLCDIKKWIEEQVSKPDTAILGIEELIIDWDGQNYLFHHVRFL
ncbi:hypothetical protein [Priestia megaterium]|uniref:hypothetical protein n=1 Tax=Priestia megaterium TaxID=1404 RepID=UPI001A94BE42|nr:hypothetical protein [Priestia megaterium]QSX18452.1 hypothetical protein J0P05_14300 [Priestia megaterium]